MINKLFMTEIISFIFCSWIVLIIIIYLFYFI